MFTVSMLWWKIDALLSKWKKTKGIYTFKKGFLVDTLRKQFKFPIVSSCCNYQMVVPNLKKLVRLGNSLKRSSKVDYVQVFSWNCLEMTENLKWNPKKRVFQFLKFSNFLAFQFCEPNSSKNLKNKVIFWIYLKKWGH